MKRKSGLGKGLDALLPTTPVKIDLPGTDTRPRPTPVPDAPVAEVPAPAAVRPTGLVELDIEDIHPGKHQPRTAFSPEELDELTASIREQGVLQPVVVRPRDEGGYELLMGERRLRASKMAGAKRVPAIVREVDDRQALEQAVVENVQRADLQPLDEAHAYRHLVDLFELTQEQVAKRVGKSRVYITNTLRLLDLPEPVKTLLYEGKLQAGHARALLAIPTAERQSAIAKKAVDQQLTVRKIEELARKESDPKPAKAPSGEPQRRRFPDLEESLNDHLGTEVKIEAGRGKGRVVISFGNRDDLHRIVELLLGY